MEYIVMPRHPNTKQISFAVTAAQFAAFLLMAAKRGMKPAEYARWLIQRDGDELGIIVPDDLPKRGKYDRKVKP